MLKRSVTLATLALAGLLAACSSDGDGPASGAESVVGADAKAQSADLAGQYEIATPYDLTGAGVFPAPVNDTLKALSNFEEHPSQTLIDLLGVAKVPAAGFLDAIPSLIRGEVLGYIDDHVFKTLFDGVPIAKKVAGLLDDTGSLATKFSLVTTLDLPGLDATGNAKATHSIRGAGYSWDGKDHVLDIPADLRAKFGSVPVDANAVLIGPRSKDLEIGRLEVKKHSFTVPIGSFAIRAMDQMATERFGADLRGSLGKLIDCDALADDVSKRCIDPPGPGKICVDHKTEIAAACTAGLDLLIGNMQAALKELDLSLDLNLGTAQMWDQLDPTGPLDGKADRLDVGYWEADLKGPSGTKSMIAPFAGHRVVAAVPK